MYGTEVLANALVRETHRQAHARRFVKQAAAAHTADSRRSFPILSQLLALWRGSRPPRVAEQTSRQPSAFRLNLRNE